MGFFDRDVRDGFDAMFDLNHDGKIDFFEEYIRFDLLDKMANGNFEQCEDDQDGTGGDYMN